MSFQCLYDAYTKLNKMLKRCRVSIGNHGKLTLPRSRLIGSENIEWCHKTHW